MPGASKERTDVAAHLERPAALDGLQAHGIDLAVLRNQDFAVFPDAFTMVPGDAAA